METIFKTMVSQTLLEIKKDGSPNTGSFLF